MSEIGKRNKKLAINVVIFIIGMVCLTYASFPLYNLFCKVTGYQGTPKKTIQVSNKVGNKNITVTFNADVDNSVGWKFYPEEQKVIVRTGENKLIYFVAVNNSDKESTAVASFNVTPPQIGQYFNKIQCFCFTKQTLKPHEKVRMPVVFFIDPKIEEDKEVSDIDMVTLSYTFFKEK